MAVALPFRLSCSHATSGLCWSSPRRLLLNRRRGSCSRLLIDRQQRYYASNSTDQVVSFARNSEDSGPRKKIVVAMTGATGSILGIRLLETLRKMNIESHLIISKWAEATIKYETTYSAADVRSLATYAYGNANLSAPISSGSFQVDGMIIVPCSMKTLGSIRAGYSNDLISRSADVILKERRKLVMVVRETPLSDIHLENMLSLTRSGAIVFPPVPAFYTKPETIDDIVDQSVGRMLDMFHLNSGDFKRWNGFERN